MSFIGQHYVLTGLIGVILTGLGFFVADVSFAPLIAGILFDLGYVSWLAKTGRPTTRRARTVLIAVPLFGFIVGSAYLGPSPLENVKLRLSTSQLVEGDLVATPATGPGNWFVGEKNDRIEAVPTERVVRSLVFRRKGAKGKYEGKTLFDLIRD